MDQTPILTETQSGVRPLHIAILAIVSLTTSLSVFAIKPSDTPLDYRLQNNPSVDDIARQINRQHKWRILAAEPKVENSKTLYHFKLLNKKRGRVQVIVIDPKEPNLKALEKIKLQ